MDDIEMGTPISGLKINNIENKDLVFDKINDFERSNLQHYKPKKDMNLIIKNIEHDIQKYSDPIPKLEPSKVALKKKDIEEVKHSKVIELSIYVVLFIMLNNDFVLRLIYLYLSDNSIISLSVRSIIFGVIIYFLRKYY
jgi:hypothetical protein